MSDLMVTFDIPFFSSLHDGGFTDPTPDGEPAQPYWYSWMENIAEYKITIDMKYSGMVVRLRFIEI